MINYSLITEDGETKTYLRLYSTDNDGVDVNLVVELYTSKSNDAYNSRVDRFNILVKKFNSNHFDRKLICKYLPILKCGAESGFIFNRYGIKFDTLDLVNNKLVKSDKILGGVKDNRVSAISYFPSEKYSQLTHLKGKYAGYTKCYIPRGMLHNSNVLFYSGKASYSVDGYDYISMLDMVEAKSDNLTDKKRWILGGTNGFSCIVDGTYYMDVAKRTIRELSLVSCENCSTYVQKVDHHGTCEACRSKGVKMEVSDYSHKPNPIFIRLVGGRLKSFDFESAKFDSYHYYGGELEVELRAGTSNDYKKIIADEIMNIKTSDGQRIFYCKYDGSLDTGFEIVSHPMTFNAWKHFDFEGLIYKYRSYIRSYNTNTAGMHLHVSRNAFTDFEAVKVLKLTYEFPKLSLLMSERSIDSHNEWARLSKSQIKTITKIAVESSKDKYNPTCYGWDIRVAKAVGGHRGAWNFRNSNTAECRLFKGQLRPLHFYKNIEYVEAMLDFVKNTSIKNLDACRFVGFIKSNFQAYPNLNRFLNRRKSVLVDCLQNPKEVPEGLHV